MPLGLVLLLILLPLSGCFGNPPPVARDLSSAPFDLVPVADGFDSPLLALAAGDDAGRLFVVEQTGSVRMVRDGSVVATPFLDVSNRIATGGERGLLGFAFHPAFRENGRVFASYSDTEGDTRVVEYTVDPSDADRVAMDSAREILAVAQPYANHNGGHIAFGPDGFLYIGLGDGGAAGDPLGHGQNRATLLGSILRVDVDDRTAAYRIPESNPFVGSAWREEIWAFGLRNPWRFSFDRGTGDLWIGDVGQGDREEISREPAGGPGGVNYGWNVWEGTKRYRSGEAVTTATGPVTEYAHSDEGGGHCSVTGGHVYRGRDLPALQGTYVFADYCSGTIWGLRPDAPGGDGWTRAVLGKSGFRVSSFGEDANGELLVVDHGGAVHRIAPRNR